MSKIDKKDIVYLDESGIRNNEAKAFGWSLKGSRLYDLKSGTNRKVLNIAAALRNGKIIAPFIFEGRCDKEVFNTYLFQILKNNLKPTDYVVLDNASFHKASKIREICASVGCRLEFLPPYSPDFNEIEHHWFSLKTKLRKLIGDKNKSLMELTEEVFMRTD